MTAADLPSCSKASKTLCNGCAASLLVRCGGNHPAGTTWSRLAYGAAGQPDRLAANAKAGWYGRNSEIRQIRMRNSIVISPSFSFVSRWPVGRSGQFSEEFSWIKFSVWSASISGSWPVRPQRSVLRAFHAARLRSPPVFEPVLSRTWSCPRCLLRFRIIERRLLRLDTTEATGKSGTDTIRYGRMEDACTSDSQVKTQ